MNRLAALAALFAAFSAGCSGCSGCSKGDGEGETPVAANEASAPMASAASGDPGSPIDLMAQRLGVAPLMPQLTDGAAKGDLLFFPVKGAEARELVLKHHAAAFDLGAYLFLFRPNDADKQALLGLAHTKDALEAVRIVGTTAHSPPHDTTAIVAWLTELDHLQPLGLTGIGLDFVEGGFDGPVKDPATIAAKVNAFCPEFAANLAAAHEEDATQAVQKWFASSRNFYFTWE
jgi:hypothetical protein